MATPSAAAGTATKTPATSAGDAGATPVDDGLAAILAGPSTQADPADADPADADPADADPADADPADADPADADPADADPADADPADADPADADPADADPADADPADADPADADPAVDPKNLDGKLDAHIARARAKFTPELQPVFDGVIKQVRAETSALKTQLAQVTPELETLRQTNEVLLQGTAPLVDGGNPLAAIKTEPELATHLAQQRKARNWALRNPKGGVVRLADGKGGVTDQEISEERVGEILAETEEALQVHGPAQQQFLRDRREWDRQLSAELPAAVKKDSPLRIQMNAVLKRYPWLNQVAEGPMMAADLVIASALRAQHRAAAAKGKGGLPAKPGAAAPGARKPAPGNPPSVPGGQRPPKIAAKTKVLQERVKRFETTGKDDDNAVLGALLTG